MTTSPPEATPEATPEPDSGPAASLAAIARVPVGAPFTWLAKGLTDLYAAPAPSLFYGLAFALMGWAIVFFYGHAYSLTVALMGGFMLLGPGLAMGLYGLSRQREAGQKPRLQPSLTIWRANLSNLMLRDEVVQAVAAGQFQIHAVSHVDEAIAQLTGLPAGRRSMNGEFESGSINANIEVRLLGFAEAQAGLAATAADRLSADG